MGFTQKRSGLAESVALLVLCALFFILAAAAIATGVSAYNGSAGVIEGNDIYRTSLAYLSNQARRADTLNGFEVVPFLTGNAMLISEESYDDGEGNVYEYCTYIYCWGGWLRELYVEKGLELEPNAGIEIMEMTAIYFGVTADRQLVAAIIHGDVSGYITISPRSHTQMGVVLP